MTAFQTTEKGAEIEFSGATMADVVDLVDRFLVSSGFRLRNGPPHHGTYEIGSGGVRFFAGGLVKRQKYNVSISGEHGRVHASIASAMSGAGGSVLGVMREMKGRKTVTAALKAFLEDSLA